MKRTIAALVMVCAVRMAIAADPAWIGLRGPTKVSAEDGLNEKQLGKKIGKFINLASTEEWGAAINAVHAKFPGAKPWVTWAVGELKGATALTDKQHEEMLAFFDGQKVTVFLEIWPSGKDAAGVTAAIEEFLGKYKGHGCVAGLCIDLEYYKPKVDDATAKAWDEKVKGVNAEYRLVLKHWDEAKMPPTYRGKGDVMFIDMSSEAPRTELNAAYAAWAEHFAPNPVAFQIGYPADEDEMNGGNKGGWWTMKDPIKEWTDEIMTGMKDPKQEVGILWVTARSGKTYNSAWDLTKGVTTPGAKTGP